MKFNICPLRIALFAIGAGWATLPFVSAEPPTVNARVQAQASGRELLKQGQMQAAEATLLAALEEPKGSVKWSVAAAVSLMHAGFDCQTRGASQQALALGQRALEYLADAAKKWKTSDGPELAASIQELSGFVTERLGAGTLAARAYYEAALTLDPTLAKRPGPVKRHLVGRGAKAAQQTNPQP